jgi:molybdopterin-binding protein
MAEVVMDVGGVEVVAATSKDSAERLNLAAGDSVVAVIKATDVIVGRRET